MSYSLFLNHYAYLILYYLIKTYFKIFWCKRTLVTFVLIEKIHSYIYISKETKKSIILKRNDQETPKIILLHFNLFNNLFWLLKNLWLILLMPLGQKVQVNRIIYCLFDS